MKTMRNADFTLIIFYVAIIVLALNVDVAESAKKGKGKNKDEEEDYHYDEESTTENASAKQKELMKEMKQFKRIKPAPIITYGPYTFEGVDYQDMPKHFFDTYHDCYYEHLRCIRFTTHLHVVCVYDLWKGWLDWTNHCQVDLTNCIHRVSNSKGFYGTSNRNDVMYYNGDGVGCSQTLRNGRKSEPDSVISFVRQRRLGNDLQDYTFKQEKKIQKIKLKK
ncbi:uncharacterized protein LOC113495485 isoform X2 [Trichoplusia ni]|uniref:Uncharacterized protein LOC113495485 isoform X2 n=1 Tax=Trichoplusia ni TaxID=7111 RepID=A0A7E5VP20_TRINI|nr:uncharacterized protein LOC113495485 isoform X2 [Trichoplusia ni]